MFWRRVWELGAELEGGGGKLMGAFSIVRQGGASSLHLDNSDIAKTEAALRIGGDLQELAFFFFAQKAQLEVIKGPLIG